MNPTTAQETRVDEEQERALFVPLKAEYFHDFANGMKRTEYRRYGPRWNERTCRPGRRIVLSLGYGKGNRLTGVVTSFVGEPLTCLDAATMREMVALFGDVPKHTRIACIGIAIDPVQNRSNAND